MAPSNSSLKVNCQNPDGPTGGAAGAGKAGFNSTKARKTICGFTRVQQAPRTGQESPMTVLLHLSSDRTRGFPVPGFPRAMHAHRSQARACVHIASLRNLPSSTPLVNRRRRDTNVPAPMELDLILGRVAINRSHLRRFVVGAHVRAKQQRCSERATGPFGPGPRPASNGTLLGRTGGSTIRAMTTSLRNELTRA